MRNAWELMTTLLRSAGRIYLENQGGEEREPKQENGVDNSNSWERNWVGRDNSRCKCFESVVDFNMKRKPRLACLVFWKSEPCVYIGRPSKWGNPWRAGGALTVQEAIERYDTYIRDNEYLLSCLPELLGKKLGCWCNGTPCHGHVLITLLEERYGKSKTKE